MVSVSHRTFVHALRVFQGLQQHNRRMLGNWHTKRERRKRGEDKKEGLFGVPLQSAIHGGTNKKGL